MALIIIVYGKLSSSEWTCIKKMDRLAYATATSQKSEPNMNSDVLLLYLRSTIILEHLSIAHCCVATFKTALASPKGGGKYMKPQLMKAESGIEQVK